MCIDFYLPIGYAVNLFECGKNHFSFTKSPNLETVIIIFERLTYTSIYLQTNFPRLMIARILYFQFSNQLYRLLKLFCLGVSNYYFERGKSIWPRRLRSLIYWKCTGLLLVIDIWLKRNFSLILPSENLWEMRDSKFINKEVIIKKLWKMKN